MFKKQIVMLLFFLSMFIIWAPTHTNDNAQEFALRAKMLKQQGLNMRQIYDRLKQKKESFFSFVLRLDRATKISLEKSKSDYPYQKPQNFNSQFVQEDYYFLGDILIYGSNSDTWQLRNSDGELIRNLRANKLEQLSPLNVKADTDDNIYEDMQKFRISTAKGLKFSLIPNNKNLLQISGLFENNKKFLTLYIGNPTSRGKVTIKDSLGITHTETVQIPAKGFKVILDKDKFRDYLTQTFFYKLMLDNFKYPVVGFGLGFSIDPTKVALIDIKDPLKVINLFNIKLIFKVTKEKTSTNHLITETYYDSERLDIQEKIREHNYIEQIKYADLFGIGALSVKPLTNQDTKKIGQIK